MESWVIRVLSSFVLSAQLEAKTLQSLMLTTLSWPINKQNCFTVTSEQWRWRWCKKRDGTRMLLLAFFWKEMTCHFFSEHERDIYRHSIDKRERMEEHVKWGAGGEHNANDGRRFSVTLGDALGLYSEGLVEIGCDRGLGFVRFASRLSNVHRLALKFSVCIAHNTASALVCKWCDVRGVQVFAHMHVCYKSSTQSQLSCSGTAHFHRSFSYSVN